MQFAEALIAGAFDLVIFTTGVGVRTLVKAVSEHMDREQFLAALRTVKIAARGPKSSTALRELGIPITVIAPEPFTWRVLMQAMEELAHGHVDAVLFMNAGQVAHLFLMAERMGYTEALYEGFRSTVIGSIGPSTTEGLSMYRLTPDFEPSQSKMGFLIKEIAENAERLLDQKRTAASLHVSGGVVRPISALLTDNCGTAQATRPELSGVDFLHEIVSRMAASDPLHTVLNRIVDFACSLIQCDSCFVYVLEDNQLVLRASKNPNTEFVDRLGIWLGQGITGWVGWHREPVAIPEKALKDPRFQRFKNLPEDTFEAFLSVPILCRGKLIGVINLQHRKPYYHTEHEVRLLTAAGYLVGAELERARLETEIVELSDRLESRKQIERAKGVLQRDFGLDEESAYRAMQRESRQRRKSMREIAEAILLNDDLRKTRWSTAAQEEERGPSSAA
jgi:uroporphyrinogen-III synthase